MRHGVARPDARSLRFTQANTDKGGQLPDREEHRDRPPPRRVVLRVRLVSLDGRKYQLYALHDPALGNDGEDDRARTSGHALVARDGSAGSALVSRPGFDRDLERLLRHRQRRLARPRGAPPAEPDLRRRRTGQRRAGRPGRRRDRTARAPHRDAGPRLRRDAGGREAHGGHVGRDVVRHHGASLRRRLALLPRQHPRRPRERGGRASGSTSPPRSCSPPPRTSCTRARSSPRRARRGSGATRSTDLSKPSGAYHEVWSRDAYQFGTALWADGRQGRRAPDRRLAVHHAAEGRRLVPAELRRHRQAGVDQPPARRGRAADRARAPDRARPTRRPTRT